MATYYEILGISQNANKDEIEAAIDTQYDKWRRLVNHHDAAVVDEANKSLRTLEQIRETLTNDANRKVYDSSLNVGGLADPEALLKSMNEAGNVATPPPPPGAPQQQAPKVAAAAQDLWVCPKCSIGNAKGTQFCAECGEKIGKPCPQCQELIFKETRFCPHCGVNVLEKEEEVKKQAEEQFKANIKATINFCESHISEFQTQIMHFEDLKSNKMPVFQMDKLGRELGQFSGIRITYAVMGSLFACVPA